MLPIVGRELRIRARRASTYWFRVSAATAALLLVLLVMFGGGYLAMSGDGASGSAEDPAALAAGADVVWEPDRCAEMGARGREFVMAHYERRALALRYLALLGQQGAVNDR